MSKPKTSAAVEPIMINDSNLSRAWSRLMLHVLDGAGTEVSPLVLSVTGFDETGAASEEPSVRLALDRLLQRKGCLKVEDVSFTIFPQRIWEISQGDRERLFSLYRAAFPRWQAMNKKVQRPWSVFRAYDHVWSWTMRWESIGMDIIAVWFTTQCASLDVASNNI